MSAEYEILFSPNETIRDEAGNITYHPLDGPYPREDGIGTPALYFSYNYYVRNLALFNDIKVVNVMFFRRPAGRDGREAWADPIRAAMLERLARHSGAWYAGFEAGIDTSIPSFSVNRVSFAYESFYPGYPDREKIVKYTWLQHFFELPAHSLPTSVPAIWQNHPIGEPIEGYHMEEGQIDVLKEWENAPKDEGLLRAVFDAASVVFFTFPTENRHFTFMTAKYSLDEFAEIIDLEGLRKMANELE